MGKLHTTSLALLVAAAVTGCGGDDARESESSKPVSAAAARPDSGFLAEAEAICKDANDKETAAGITGIDWIYSDLFTDREFLREITAAGRSALRRLRTLSPPAARQAQFETALDGIDTMLEGLDMQRAALRRGKDAGNALATIERGYTDLVAAGGPLGFTECLGVVL